MVHNMSAVETESGRILHEFGGHDVPREKRISRWIIAGFWTEVPIIEPISLHQSPTYAMVVLLSFSCSPLQPRSAQH